MTQDEVVKQIGQIVHRVVQANNDYFRLWSEHVLFTWQWWVSLLLLVAPVCVWIIYRKKIDHTRLWRAGLFVLLISSWLDFAGNSYGLWWYPHMFLPVIPPFLPFETALAFEVMLLLQYKSASSSYVKAAVLGLANSFVLEPAMKWIGLYEPVHWKYIYSLPIYCAIYLFAGYLYRRDISE